jgi:hypothetical protein
MTSSTLSRVSLRAAGMLLIVLLLPAGARAQLGGEWNTDRVLELVSQARELRSETAVDSAFQAYASDARGYIYFFLDRPDTEERVLVKTDQIALEIYWRAPSETRQRIVGMRDQKELPTTIKYHLDHLTVVQDDFGDLIRMGDGDEVEAVLHPVASGSSRYYDFRLADSLSIRMAGGPTPELRVYEVQVRPRDFEKPGFIGSVYLQRATGAIVRMSFTFTPASYVDPHLDYIRVSLDNLAWDGKFWLPYRQEAEIRRELPQLEFLAGSVIRGRFEIGNYRINPRLPVGLFSGPRVTAAPRFQRENFAFEEGLHDRLETEGLDPSPELETIRTQAYEVMGRRYLSGLSQSRLYVPAVSSLYRYDRAEGSFAGGGMAFRPTTNSRIKITAGYAFGRGKPSTTVEVARYPAVAGPSLRVEWNVVNDLGGHPGASSTVNTISALVAEEDYLDPFFATGVEARQRWWVGSRTRLEMSAAWERIRSGNNVVSEGAGGFRPVRSVDEGDGALVRFTAKTAKGPVSFRATVDGGRFTASGYATVGASVGYSQTFRAQGITVGGSVEGGWISDDAPLHRYFLLGGRLTLPGHGYREFVGDRMALARLEVGRQVFAPWLSLRVFGAAGATSLHGRAVPDEWLVRTTDGIKASVGAGVSMGWDVLRLDWGRGLGDDGDWEVLFSVHQRFWPWL